eukprot:m.10979 g.10979  ORF g.10979 m.10979 type:complete len:301 (+) comp4357_c0_seq1:171-1073(+)
MMSASSQEEVSLPCLKVPKHRMTLQTYAPGPDNDENYRLGWKCDRCGFGSSNNPSSAMARQRFHCVMGCEVDLCFLCAKRQNPTIGEEPAKFKVPKLDISILSYKETMTGSGAVYNVKITDEEDRTWVVPKRFTDFEFLHMNLKPRVLRTLPQFPKKEMFPSVSLRARQFSAYLTSLCAGMKDLDDQTLQYFLKFLQAVCTVDFGETGQAAATASTNTNAISVTPELVAGQSYQDAAPEAPASVKKLREAKVMLDENLIGQEEFDKIKSAILSKLVDEKEDNENAEKPEDNGETEEKPEE